MIHPFVAACCLISGTVRAPSGAPIAQAHLTFTGPKDASSATGPDGTFALVLPPGRYDLTSAAQGYATVTVDTGEIARDARVQIVMQPLASPQLRTIGSVTVNGALALVRNAVPAVEITRDQLDELGYSNAAGGLQQVPSLNVQSPDGGAPTTPQVISLRGPDPSEALVTLDGQVLNDNNTGDLDVALLPVAAFQSIDVTEGLGPEDSEGSNTFGGAVNFISLQPTQSGHVALSQSAGSFGTNQTWMNATGTIGRLGYALAGSTFQQVGQTNQTALIVPANNTPIACGGSSPNCPFQAHLGSTISSRMGLIDLNYRLSQRSSVTARLFTLGGATDESSASSGIAKNPFEPCVPSPAVPCTSFFGDVPNPEYGMHVGPGSAIFGQDIRAYLLRSQSVVGAGSLVASITGSDNDVAFTGGAVSPYDVSHRDKRYDEALSWGRTFADGDYAVGGYAQQESLAGAGIAGSVSNSINSFFARATKDLGRRFRLAGGLYQARYSTFGSSLNGRLEGSYDVGASAVVRASFGTGFRAPLLIEQYFFAPVYVDGKPRPNPALPPESSDCVVPGQGNPSERAEHATEYELGLSKVFPWQANLDVSLYRSNLRDTIETYYPLGDFCGSRSPNGFVYSYPINIGNAVYQGTEIRYRQQFPAQHVLLIAQYALNVSYPQNLAGTAANPTSGATLVNGEQFLQIPQQQGSLSLAWANQGYHAATAAIFRGWNNELNQPPFVLVNAAAGKTFGALDVTLAGTNLTNVVSGPFTAYMAGVPYRSWFGPQKRAFVTELPTNALFVQPAAVNLILTLHE
jgi:outer membrane cobalamin receptor